MGHWVYEFLGRPGMRPYRQVADEVEPAEVVVCEGLGGQAVVDGFVRESVDVLMMVARFQWVVSGDLSTVTPELLRASGLSPSPAVRVYRLEQQE
ncbi:hypothetical protein [Streptomyces sp. NPDC004270]